MTIRNLHITCIAILAIIATSNLVYAAGGADGGKTPSDNPDPLTGSIVEERLHQDTSDHGTGPSHTQINQADINENKARLHCMKLTGKAKQDCLKRIP